MRRPFAVTEGRSGTVPTGVSTCTRQLRGRPGFEAADHVEHVGCDLLCASTLAAIAER